MVNPQCIFSFGNDGVMDIHARNRMGGFAGRKLFHVVIESETGQAADLGAFFMAAQICQNWQLVPNV